ncbi:hypothetical protein [Pantoea sp. Acro-807]|uniref:hypothetical protein n=1 Tax=Pantoea sp. Acro-807 TaxID=2608356 RepID=UPI001419B1DA|nr:hypothetical protein [Pantoea sp. Acro-807]
MKNFAQRDFVNTTSIKENDVNTDAIANAIGKFLTLCFSTIGIVCCLMLMWMAHQ